MAMTPMRREAKLWERAHLDEVSDALDVLLASGWTWRALAERLGCSTAQLHRIRHRATTPSYPLGAEIISLSRSLEKTLCFSLVNCLHRPNVSLE